MLNFKKILALVLVLVIALGTFAACGGPDKPDTPGEGEYTGIMVENGNTYADPNWLPVVKNPITVTGMMRNWGVASDVVETRSIWTEIAEKTGVSFEIQVTVGSEPENLMFASRNYPDCAFRLGVDEVQNQACYAGDVLELTDEMLETYAPNWFRVFSDNPDIYKMTLLPDGKLYYLPQFNMAENQYMLRDAAWINESWLDELGLDMPETIEEFTDYLRAVKNAAGQGSIPNNVAPLYLRGGDFTNIGSYFSILDWFGVYNGFNAEVVENGVVKHQLNNADAVPAIEYLAQLYSEGLINTDCTKNSYATYREAIGDIYTEGHTPWVGTFFSYGLGDIMRDDYCALAPMKTSAAKGPYVRATGADQRIIDNAFSIFATSEYPIALLRAFDQYACGEGAIRAIVGEKGEDKQYYENENGQWVYAKDAWNHPDNNNCYGWDNYGPGIIEPEYANVLISTRMDDTDSREYVYEHIYKNYVPTDIALYPIDAMNYLTTDEASQCALIEKNLKSITQTFIKKWITGKSNVNDEWDMFQTALSNSGLKTRLDLLQKAYDTYNASTIG